MRFRFIPRFAILSSCVLVAAGALAAQEELPAPRPAKPAQDAPRPGLPRPGLRAQAPDREALRAQRRERLRELGGQVLDTVLPATGAPDRASSLDVGKLNTGLKALLEGLFAGGGAIESLRLRFIPEGTNFAQDRIQVEASAALKHTAWADAPSRASATLAARLAQSDTGGSVAVIDGKIRLETQSIALANYALEQYKKRSATPAKGDPAPPTADEIFQRRLDEKLATVERINSLDDVADLFTMISSVRLTSASERIESLRTELSAATDEASRKRLEAELATARIDRDKLFDVRPKIERGKDGVVRAVTVNMAGTELFDGGDVRGLDVRVTENDVTADLAITISRFIELYPAIKPLVVGVLERIQSGDPRALEALRPLIGGAIGRGWELIVGQEATSN
ncbi:MAG: hypothetical protein HYX69_00745 [Planctomycetia bacterium]|nr:hypothetical protein [Planctomycetia bacterium]